MAPMNGQIFDYSFMNLLFDEENGRQIFRGGASRWLTITPACSQHRVESESYWLKPLVAHVTRCKVAASLSTRCWKLWPSLEKDWTPSRRELRSVNPLVWHPARCCRRQNPAADIGVTRISTNSWRTTTQYWHGQMRIQQRNPPHNLSCQRARQWQLECLLGSGCLLHN